MVLPDPVAAVVAVLRADLSGTTVGTVVPDDLAAHLPFIHIAQSGGTITPASTHPGLAIEAARLVVTCWAGPDTGHARALARRVLAVALATRARPIADGVLVRCRVDAAPAYVPDDFAPIGAHRYIATLTAYTH